MKDYTEYATKDITPTMEAFAEWLVKETGYAVDARTVALAGSLRGDFQASESWKADERNPRNGAAERAEAKAKARIEAAKKAQERVSARIAKAEAELAAAKKAAKAA